MALPRWPQAVLGGPGQGRAARKAQPPPLPPRCDLGAQACAAPLSAAGPASITQGSQQTEQGPPGARAGRGPHGTGDPRPEGSSREGAAPLGRPWEPRGLGTTAGWPLTFWARVAQGPLWPQKLSGLRPARPLASGPMAHSGDTWGSGTRLGSVGTSAPGTPASPRRLENADQRGRQGRLCPVQGPRRRGSLPAQRAPVKQELGLPAPRAADLRLASRVLGKPRARTCQATLTPATGSAPPVGRAEPALSGEPGKRLGTRNPTLPLEA